MASVTALPPVDHRIVRCGLAALAGASSAGASIARTLSSRRRWRASPLNVRREEGDAALERRLGPDDPGAERQDVHVVVLDALVGRVGVVADGGADAADLVRRDARADAGAADEDAALGLAVADRVARAAAAKSG